MSSQEFIRALKAPSDPPVSNGPLKIEIARSCWDDTSLHVPRKEEVITDWILTKFHKDEASCVKIRSFQFIYPNISSALDASLWKLLGDVLTNSQIPLKTWLPPILNRVSISTAVISLLSLSSMEGSTNGLFHSARNCLEILWPLSVRKLNAEVLLECFGASLVAMKNSEHNDSIIQIVSWITKSFRLSLSNTSNKKKVNPFLMRSIQRLKQSQIYATFTQSYLLPWISTIPSESIGDTLYDAGIEILFNLDMLRQINEKENTLFDSLQDVPLFILPRLFSSFILATKRLRGALFGHSSSQHSTGGLENVRAAAIRFFVSAQVVVAAKEHTAGYWNTQRDLLLVVKDQSLFTGQQELEDACRAITDFALVALKNYDIAGMSMI